MSPDMACASISDSLFSKNEYQVAMEYSGEENHIYCIVPLVFMRLEYGNQDNCHNHDVDSCLEVNGETH